MRTDPTPFMLEEAHRHAMHHRDKGAAEACGVFFYPDRLMAKGEEGACVPKFIPIPNRAFDPAYHFEFDYKAMESAIRWEYTGAPSGFVQVFHSHLTDAPPSPDDFAMVDALEQGLEEHPIWHPTLQHKLLCLPSARWIDFNSTVAEDTFSASTNQGRTIIG